MSLSPCSGVVNLVIANNVQISSLLKRLANQSQISCGASLGWGNKGFFMNSPGHMTKIATMLLYGLNLYNLLNDLETRHGPSGTQGLQTLYK